MRRDHMHRTLLVCTMLWIATLAGEVSAWDEQGHRIVCRIAFELLSDQGRALVRTTREWEPFVSNPDNEPRTTPSFEASCVWPDDARHDTHLDTYEYHFINVPKAAPELLLARDCAALDCVLVAIQRYAQYLARTPEGDREKGRQAEALRFLGHFVGDLHQPLHVSHAEDRGGNSLAVTWFGQPTNLHKVWDALIAERGSLTTEQDALALVADITAEERQRWATFDGVGWARESLQQARQVAYVQPDGTDVLPGTALAEPYFARALPVVREQLKKAGVRLAHLLNAAADGTLPPNLLQLSE
jgi:hypothetical protein